MYARKKIYLLDDVLSGLDGATEESVFNRLFDKSHGLLRKEGLSVVLVTQAGKPTWKYDHLNSAVCTD